MSAGSERSGELRGEGVRGTVHGILRGSADHLSAEEQLEQLLAARRRELEEHTRRFEERVRDLERRERIVLDARASIDRLLRLGTSDLEAREVEIAELLTELSEREERLREQEADLARRRVELGAVELRRAALEARERALAEREARIEAAEAHLPPPTAAARESLVPEAQLLFVPGPAYRLVEVERPPLAAGAAVAVEGVPYRVLRVGPSPLPGDPRRCAYLEPVPGAAVPGGAS
ncbi:MAG TPA: hypothetical protein VNJ53_01785 [Gaiellaceae bacterium]|nr:hypothetical protein [Gaiellaceae bacterium]